MRKMILGKTGVEVPVVAVGCMRMAGVSVKDAENVIKTAMDLGMNFFDHADIYGGGKSEEIFSQALGMNADTREKVILQSKCAIRPNMYDFSKEHILEAVDGSLQRLNTDYLDVLLLHRPDALMEPEEVAEAFDSLYESGKVRHFGVSNHNPMQIQLLEKYLHQPVSVNQLQFSITNCTMVSSGVNVNMTNDSATNRDGDVLNYCRLNDITIQPWSPLQYGFFEGVFLGSDKYPELNKKIDELAEKYGVSNTTIAFAWILRHPAHMMPIAGSMNVSRIKDIAKASEIKLTRQEWYEVYIAAGNKLP